MDEPIIVKIEPSPELVANAKTILNMTMPTNSEERFRYNCHINIMLNELLDYKLSFYRMINSVFDNGIYGSVPIEYKEDKDIEQAICALLNKSIKIYHER